MLEEAGLGDYWLTSRLGYGWRVPDLNEWRALVQQLVAMNAPADQCWSDRCASHWWASMSSCRTPT